MKISAWLAVTSTAAAMFTCSARAEDGGVDVDAGVGATEQVGMTPEEAAALERQLAAENAADAAATPSSSIPDLSKVNLAAGIPGIQGVNPDLSIIFDIAGAGFGTIFPSRASSPFADAPLQTGGHDPTENGFTLRQVELAFSASVDPFLRFDASLVIKDELEVEEAVVTTSALPFSLQGRGGMFFSKLGRQNEQHPHQWAFVSQPLVYGHLLGEDGSRGLGAELSWLSPLPWPVTLIAQVQGTSGACCSFTYSPGEEAVPVRTPFDLVYTGVVEQFFPITDDLSLLWGVSAQAGPAPYFDDTGRGRAELWATDANLRWRPADSASRMFIELQAEALLRTRHGSAGDVFGDALVDGGAYAQVVWHPTTEYGVGARYEYVYGLPGEPAGASLGPNTQRGAILAEYAPTHFSRVMAEVNTGTRGQGDLLWGAMINLEVSVGAHGAHAY